MERGLLSTRRASLAFRAGVRAPVQVGGPAAGPLLPRWALAPAPVEGQLLRSNVRHAFGSRADAKTRTLEC